MYARRKSPEISVSEAKEGRFCDVDNIVEAKLLNVGGRRVVQLEVYGICK